MNVLVVDDNRLSLDTYRAAIKRLGPHDVYAFHDATEAMGWATYHETDLLLLDYRMPDIDGLQFVVAFRQLPGNADVPIMMLTAEREREVRHQALQMGVSDFLNKPADPVEFTARIRNLIELREGRKALAQRADALASAVRKATEAQAAREREALMLLGAVAEYRENSGGMGQVRIGRYCALIATRLGFGNDAVHNLELAVPLHDLGKVGVPDAILLKPGSLDQREIAAVREHALLGYNLLRRFDTPLMRMAAAIAHSHHERYEGNGYPSGTVGDDIPIEGRICAVADVFDALTTRRPYREAWPYEDAMQYLRDGSGKQFDPKIVAAFVDADAEIVRILRHYADGTARAVHAAERPASRAPYAVEQAQRERLRRLRPPG